MTQPISLNTHVLSSIVETPLDMLSRVFAVAELVEKAKSQIEEADQRSVHEKTQIEEAIVS